MKKAILAIFICFSVVFNTYCHAKQIVFEGTPLTRNSSSDESTKNEQVAGKTQLDYKLIITKDGGDYIWFSRERKNLIHSKSGVYDYFVNPDGSGYIKITRMVDGKYLYLEHMSLGLQTITYWGIADKFEP